VLPLRAGPSCCCWCRRRGPVMLLAFVSLLLGNVSCPAQPIRSRPRQTLGVRLRYCCARRLPPAHVDARGRAAPRGRVLRVLGEARGRAYCLCV
jgi:hypothetical protein